MISLILNSLIPLSLCIIASKLLHHYRFVSDAVWQGMDKLNYYILFPALLFLSIARAQVALGEFGTLMLSVASVMMLAVLVLLVVKLLVGIHSHNFGVYTQSAIRFNTYVGLALVSSLFGDEGMTLFSLIIAIFIPIINVISVLSLSMHQGLSIGKMLLNLLKNPLIISCLAAMIYNATGLTVPIVMADLFKMFGSASLPLGLLCIGAGLKFGRMMDVDQLMMADRASVWVNTIVRLLGMPLMAYAICTMMGVVGLDRQVVVLFFALPTAPTAYVLTKVLGGNYPLMAQIISMQTVLAMATLPALLWWIMA